MKDTENLAVDAKIICIIACQQLPSLQSPGVLKKYSDMQIIHVIYMVIIVHCFLLPF